MNDTGKARLPGLVSPRISDADLSRWVQAVSERLEVREGARGNPYERALTVRDLVGTGLARLGSGGGVVGTAPGGGIPGIGVGDGNYEKMWEELKNSRLYKDLMLRIDDPDRFNDLADEVKAVLLNDIAEEARRRGADVQRLDTKIQTDLRSLAMSVQEVTAAADDASAGVRSVQFAQAEAGRAVAGQVTQVVARLDGGSISPADLVAPVHATLDALRTAVPAGIAGKYYQVKNPINLAPPILYRWDAARGRYVLAGMANSAAIEQVMKATADKVEGLSAEYFVKVQAGGAFGGFGLSAHEKDGVGYSQFLIAADRFAMVNPSGNLNPFAISQVNGTGPYYIYLNGQVRINARPVEDLNNEFYLSATGQVFNQNPNTNALTPTTITVTANRKGTIATAGSAVAFSTSPAVAYTAGTNAITIPSSAFASNNSVKVTATMTHNGATYSDEFTLYKVVDGADALVGFLTNESHALPASEGGAVANYDGASGEFVVFKGGAKLTAGVTYTISSKNPAALVASIGSTGQYTVTGGLTLATGTVTFRATVAGQTIDKVFTISQQRQGVTGGYTDYIFKRSTTAPGTPTGVTPFGWSDVPPTGTTPLYMSQASKRSDGTLIGAWSAPVRLDGEPGADGKYTIYQYATGTAAAATGTWSNTPPASLAADQYLWMRAGVVTPPATTPAIWGTPYRISGEKGDEGADGERGSLTGYSNSGADLVGSSWSANTTMNNHHAALIIWRMLNPASWVYPAGSPHLRIGDTVTLTNSTAAETRYWGGAAWMQPGVVIDGNLLVKGTVSADKIVAYSITADRLAAGAITADKIGSGLNASNAGYSFGFGAGSLVLGYSGAGFFKSDSANTYGLAAVHTAGNAAILGTATGPGGVAGLYGFGPINAPTYSATLAKEGVGGFFQHRNGAAGPSNDTHDRSSISTAKLATPSYAGTFQCNGITTVLCGYGGDAYQGVYTTGGLYVAGWGIVNLGLGVNGWLSVEGGAMVSGNVTVGGNVTAAGKVLTFTGAHFALLPKAAPTVLGDIVLDASVVARGGVSEVITGVTLSSAPNQKGALGVYSGDDSSVPMSMAKKGEPVAFGPDARPAFDPQYDALLQTHKVITVNALGEGQINICGEGGDLAIGDLIVTSSMPGKGMRQMKDGEVDDLVRSYTVAKVREPVRFSSPTEVKMAACIYLCG